MTSQILIRDVPDRVRAWIEEKRYEQRVTLKRFVIDLLERACQGDDELPLFGAAQQTKLVSPEFVPFTFSDLFAGIGGFRLGLDKLGGRCVFSCEWDKHAQKTYRVWFNEVPHGDIRKIRPSEIPDHDILVAGFPCQPFSLAGVSKKRSLGHPHGFKDATQGTLFFNLASIVEVKRPPVLLLENVKNLLSHNKGNTWRVILQTLEQLHYVALYKIIDAAAWVPQHRERVFIVCFDRNVFGDNPPFKFPEPPNGRRQCLKQILEPKPPEKYTLSDHLWKYLQEYARRHRAKGNGFGYAIGDLGGITRTLSARYYKDGSEILIPQPPKNPRRLTPREAARLMGFPEEKPIVVSDTQAYRQFGNAVVPVVVEAVGRQITKVFSWLLAEHNNGCLIKGRAKGNQ